MPQFEHRGRLPRVDPSAYIAPTAVLSGDVEVGPECRVLFGAVITAEDGPVVLGQQVVVMENALVRGRSSYPTRVGDNVLLGPHTHINGAEIGDGCFVATGASLFPAARLGAGAEVRINAVVHVNTTVTAGGLVPIGWVAVGDPATILPAERHDDIWAVQQHLDFPGTVYGIDRETSAEQMMTEQARWFGEHRHDRALGPDDHTAD